MMNNGCGKSAISGISYYLGGCEQQRGSIKFKFEGNKTISAVPAGAAATGVSTGINSPLMSGGVKNA